ncbi:hypothetical protein ACFE04_027537 [Oxalis oulophora]
MEGMCDHLRKLSLLGGLLAMLVVGVASSVHDYGDALSKSILFFEGQRSGKLPSTQRMSWRKNSALHDVGDPYGDHECWERPEDMDTPRTPYAVSRSFPGSEVSAEIAAALAASSIVFRPVNVRYSALLLNRAKTDELIWGAAWLYKATRAPYYWNYVEQNIHNLEDSYTHGSGAGVTYRGGDNFAEFGWDAKHAGINVLVSRIMGNNIRNSNPYVANADKFICSVLPESPSVSVSYSPGGLLFKSGGSNLQHATALSFLLLVYSRHLKQTGRVINCGGNVNAAPSRLVQVARSQVDYILGSNPLNMSYMVGYGKKFPERIHHRASSLPSIEQHSQQIDCSGGTPYFSSNDPNPNLLIGAIVGGPDISDSYSDSRSEFVHSEPTTYINAPFVGVLAFFKAHSS